MAILKSGSTVGGKAIETTEGSQIKVNTAFDRPLLAGYRESFQTLTGTSVALNADNFNIFKLATTGATTFTLSTTKTECLSITLFVEQGATPYSLSFPVSVKWKDGTIPNVSVASKAYILTFVTYNQGTTWLGSLVGAY
jgi:hypothetical protein